MESLKNRILDLAKSGEYATISSLAKMVGCSTMLVQYYCRRYGVVFWKEHKRYKTNTIILTMKKTPEYGEMNYLTLKEFAKAIGYSSRHARKVLDSISNLSYKVRTATVPCSANGCTKERVKRFRYVRRSGLLEAMDKRFFCSIKCSNRFHIKQRVAAYSLRWNNAQTAPEPKLFMPIKYPQYKVSTVFYQFWKKAKEAGQTDEKIYEYLMKKRGLKSEVYIRKCINKGRGIEKIRGKPYMFSPDLTKLEWSQFKLKSNW